MSLRGPIAAVPPERVAAEADHDEQDGEIERGLGLSLFDFHVDPGSSYGSSFRSSSSGSSFSVWPCSPSPFRRGSEILRGLRDRRRLRRLDAELDLEVLERLFGEHALHPFFGLDLGDALFRQIRGDAHLAAVLIDLLLDDRFDLTEVRRQVDVEGLRELGDLRFGGAHLQLGVVLLDLLAHFDQLAVGMLNLLETVAVRGLVHLQLLLVGGELFLGFLQLERELRGGRPIAGLQIGLGLGLELLHVRSVGRHLAGHTLDEAAILLEPAAAFLELLDRLVVLVAHLRDRVGLPEDVGNLVDLSHER